MTGQTITGQTITGLTMTGNWWSGSQTVRGPTVVRWRAPAPDLCR